MRYPLMLQAFIAVVHIVPEARLHRPNVRGEFENRTRRCIAAIKPGRRSNYARHYSAKIPRLLRAPSYLACRRIICTRFRWKRLAAVILPRRSFFYSLADECKRRNIS